MKKINILLIGFGPHAQRIYYPISLKDGAKNNFKIIAAVDLIEKKENINNYLNKYDKKPELLFINKEGIVNEKVTQNLSNKLKSLVKKHNINAVIIATDPLVHKPYALWALKNNLNVLMDKPITAVCNASTNIKAAKKISSDYIKINKLYTKQKDKNPSLVFSLMAQRRFHPAYEKMRDLISEVYKKTNCPVTSIQSFHSDGQWRMPSEIIDLDYHSYNYGFGKFSHTGYHSMDIMHWLIEAAESDEKKINNIDIFTNIVRPNDFFTQLNTADYKKIFSNYKENKKYSDKDLFEKTKVFGEIDAFSTFAFKHNDQTVTLGSLNLVHNGFSQRGWLQPNIDNLYKGNGRLRHETHFVEQGPFQAISFISYQSKEVDPSKKQGIYDIGGEYHLDIHVFRNNTLFPNWKSYEKISIKDLDKSEMEGHSRGHQEDARRKCMLEFINCVNNKKQISTSDLSIHLRSATLMSGLYQSAAKRFNKKNPLVNLEF